MFLDRTDDGLDGRNGMVGAGMHFTRLPLCSQQLQPLFLMEFDKNIDGPFVKTLVSADANFSGTTNTCGEWT